jgi:tartrate dehydratase alpha subunit/fumarate hydratase class I-like protein
MRLAKEAAVLRPLGSRNPDSVLAALEGELLAAARDMGLGPMGARGINAVIGLHIAVAVTHTAALPVAVNAQCMVGRRWKAMLKGDGSAEYTGIFT